MGNSLDLVKDMREPRDHIRTRILQFTPSAFPFCAVVFRLLGAHLVLGGFGL